MQGFGPEKLYEVLPQDILNLLVQFISYKKPKITTLLDKKNRDNYFKKNGMVIDCDNMPKNICCKYKIKLNRFSDYYINDIDPKIIAQTTVIKADCITNLERVLGSFTNLKMVKGVVDSYGNNLETLSKIDNKLIVRIIDKSEITDYRSVSPPNLLWILNIDNSIDNTDLLGLENKIYCCSDYLIQKDKLYPNLKYLDRPINIESLLEKNLDLPKLKLVQLPNNTELQLLSAFTKRYPTVAVLQYNF